MKRRLFILLASLLLITAKGFAYDEANYLYASNIEASAGSQVILPINLHNDTLMSGLQFDLHLPEGVTVVMEDEETLEASLAKRASGFTWMGSQLKDSTYRFLIFPSSKDIIADTDGTILNITLNIADTVKAGVYNIYLVDVDLSTESEKTLSTKGNAWESTLTVTEYIGPTLDENSTTAPEATSEEVTVTVKRTITANQWSTICLPFAMTEAQLKAVFGDDVQLADMSSVESGDETEVVDGTEYTKSITVYFESISLSDGLEANHPCIIKVSEDIETFQVEGVTISPEETPTVQIGKKKSDRCYMYGNYIAGTLVPEEDLFISDNKFYYSTGSTTIKGFRAYFELNDVIADYYKKTSTEDAKVYFMVDGVVTSINDILQETVNDNRYYDINGRYVGTDAQHLQRGLYIINGKKVIVK